MNTGRQTGKTKKVNKGVVGQTLSKKGKVKVVDVKLSTKKKSTKAASKTRKAGAKKEAKATSKAKATTKAKAKAKTKATTKAKAATKAKAKKTAPAKETKAKSSSRTKAAKRTTKEAPVKAKETKRTQKKKAQSLKTEPAKKKKKKLTAKEKKPIEEAKIEELRVPPPELLKPFRAMAKQKRKLMREKGRSTRRSSTFLAKPPRKGRKYLLDLRVHSPGSRGYFSPGGIDPGAAIVRLARVKGLDAIGLTDFYNASYIDMVKKIGGEANVRVIPGVDLCCEVAGCCEIFITVLFPELATADHIYYVLNELRVPESAYGDRSYVIRLPFSEVVRIIERNGGLIIPSRIDKTPYRQLAIPTLVEEYGLHAFDLVHPENPDFFRKRWPDGEFTFFSFSNANALGQIGNRTIKVKLSTPGFEGVKERVQRRVDQ